MRLQEKLKLVYLQFLPTTSVVACSTGSGWEEVCVCVWTVTDQLDDL